MIACLAQWQDAERAMSLARRCWEGWRQASQQDLDTPSTAIRHAYHTHEALHEAARAIAAHRDLPCRGDDTGRPPR